MIWDRVFSGKNEKPPQSYDLRDIADIMNLQIVGRTSYKGKSGNGKDSKHRFTTYGLQRAWIRASGFVPEVVPDSVPEVVPDDDFEDFDGDFFNL